MKLLITTQAVDRDDPILGFFHRWIEEFAGQCEQVTVICLREGNHALPANVRVQVLGGGGKIGRAFTFLRLSWGLRKEYDRVLVHMNPEYIVLAGAFWRLSGKRVALWYTHKSVTFKLRIATLFASVVLSASKESFRLGTKKLHVLGHGIDMERFVCPPHAKGAELRILTAGRISKTKNIHLILDAVEVLRVRGVSLVLTVAGAPGAGTDAAYAEDLYRRAGNTVLFVGPKQQQEVAALLCNSDVFINLSDTGSLDKAVLEALASGVPAVSSNEAFKQILTPYGLFVTNDRQAVAEALMRARTVDITRLTADIRAGHSLSALIPAILKELA